MAVALAVFAGLLAADRDSGGVVVIRLVGLGGLFDLRKVVSAATCTLALPMTDDWRQDVLDTFDDGRFHFMDVPTCVRSRPASISLLFS